MEAHAYLKFPDDESDWFSEVPRESHDVVWWNPQFYEKGWRKKSEKLIWIYMYNIYLIIMHIYLSVYAQIHTYKYN